jgi:hypothetical protein
MSPDHAVQRIQHFSDGLMKLGFSRIALDDFRIDSFNGFACHTHARLNNVGSDAKSRAAARLTQAVVSFGTIYTGCAAAPTRMIKRLLASE